MAIVKPGYLKNAIAKLDGYYTVKGEKLNNTILSQAYCDEWNGVEVVVPTKTKKPKKEKVVEATEPEVEVEATEPEVE